MHKELPADLIVESHPKLGRVTRLTIEQFYSYVKWSNGFPGVEKPSFADRRRPTTNSARRPSTPAKPWRTTRDLLPRT